MSTLQYFVEIAVAKAQRDLALRPTGARWTVARDAPGIPSLVARLQAMRPTLIGLAATGGSQRAVVATLAPAGLPVAVVDPRQVRDFAKATGPSATTDALGARALAHFAQTVRLMRRPLLDAQAMAPSPAMVPTASRTLALVCSLMDMACASCSTP